MNGERAGGEGGASTRHSNVEPVSVEVKLNVGVVSLVGFVGAGGDRRVRRGQVDHERLRGGRGVDVAGGVDRADLERVRAGGERRRVVNGDGQVANAARVDAALERRRPRSR